MTTKLSLFTFLIALAFFTSCNGQNNKQQVTIDNIVLGDTVSEIGNNIMVIYQDRMNNYWFGSWETGIYKYNGKILMNSTQNLVF